MKKYIIITLLILGCSAKTDTSEVKIAGALRTIMMENKTGANIDLRDLKNQEHLYALGAVEGLQGEILVMNSEPILSQAIEDSFSIRNDFETKATLLVYTNVSEWSSQELEANLTNQELEMLIKQMGSENNLSTPFPFKIEGYASKLNWHIVNGNSGQSHEGHATSGYNNKLQSSEVEILGFYSEAHQGIFTHMGENAHLHFKTVDGSIAGHVDDLLLEKRSLLFLPKSY